MKKILRIIFSLLVLGTISFAQVHSTTTGGEWDQTTTWVNGVVPGVTDSVIIDGPVRLFFDNPTIKSLFVNASGSLTSGWESTITVNNDVVMIGPLNTTEGNFEFHIGGNLQVYGNWFGLLKFIGTNDHYLIVAPEVSFNPDTYLMALESRIIVPSDLKIVGTKLPNIVAKEIYLNQGVKLILENVRLGSNYILSTDSIQTKLTGNGNSLYFNDNIQDSQYYIEATDLLDIKLYGNSYIGSNVNMFGIVSNEDSLHTAVGPGGWELNVEGNFTNNGTVDCDLIFNFKNNFTNNGSFICKDISILGENDHQLSASDDNWIEFTGSFNSGEGRIIVPGNLYLKTSANYLTAKDIVLESGNLFLNNVRFGNDGANYKSVIHGNNNFVYMKGLYAWYQNCELHDVQLGGYSIVNRNADFYGEVVNQDTLTNMGSNVTIEVHGNFTNNGRVFGQSFDMNFNFYKNLTNNGYYNSMFTQFVGDEDQYISLLNNESIQWNIQFNSNLTADSYQWMKNDEEIAGETGEKLLFPNGLSYEEATYKCRAVTSGENVFSRKLIVSNTLPAAFEIYDVVITNLNLTETQVDWKSTAPANGFIFYAENDTSSGYPLEAMEPAGLVLNHSLLLDNLTTGSTYYFIIDQMDSSLNDIRSIPYQFVAGDTTVGIDEFNTLPKNYSLSQNYPNPFNPTTVIEFALPTSDNVLLKVYNNIGEEVATLVNREMNAGYHSINFDAKNLSSGIYFYRITTNIFSETKKMIILR